MEITPSPTEGERAAILVALRVMISGSAAAGSLRSAWTAAGRRESLFGSSQDVAARWRRGRDRLGAW